MFDNIFVSVVPTKKVRGLSLVESGDGEGLGYDGSPVRGQMDCMPISELIDERFDCDAHFSCYIAETEGHRFDQFPRLRKEALGQLNEFGTDVKCSAVVLDLDLKDHLKKRVKISWSQVDKEEVLKDILEKAAGLEWSVFYTTLHGVRFIHSLALDVPAGGAYEALVAKFHGMYREAGLRVDGSCKDWTRLYRAPMVTREDDTETWAEPWFKMLSNEDHFYVPDDKDLIATKEAIRKPNVIWDDRPGEDEAEELLWSWDDGKRSLSEAGKKVEALLRGSAIHSYIFGGTPFARAGTGRHDKLTKLAGIVVKMVRGAEWGSVELAYAVVREACLLLEQDRDWAGKAWEMVSSFWNRDGAQVLDGPAESKEDTKESAEKATEEVGYDTKTGKPFQNRRNYQAALTGIGVEVWYNTFTETHQFKWEGEEGTITERFLRMTKGRVEDHFGFIRIVPQQWDEAVFLQADSDERHPVKEYFANLRWDGVPRLEGLFTNYFGVENLDIYREFSRIHMVAAVSRIYEPGKKYDQAVVLEAPQGAYKSSAIRALCPDPDWYVDDLPIGADSKIVIEQTSGKMFVEFAELTGIRKHETDKVKASISRQSDRARKSYGRSATDHLRRFIFWGSTNDEKYLADRTGNRRFWPVKCGKIDLKGIGQDRDQLWAEALTFYQKGSSIWLDPKYYPAQKVLQDARTKENPLREELEDWVNQYIGEQDVMLKSADIWGIILKVPVSDRARHSLAFGEALNELGFKRIRHGKERVIYYLRGDIKTALVVNKISSTTRKPSLPRVR